MTAFSSRPTRVISTSADFEHSVLASRLNSWQRKSSLRPTGARFGEQLARRGDVRRQPFQLLLDVGAGREQHRLLMQPLLVRARDRPPAAWRSAL